jgi:galactose mutarotase-like enzyme
MTDLVTIASNGLTARINPLGAELWSLVDGDGCEFMTDADPAYWTGHAPLLFPVVGSLNGGRYRLGEREYALPRHGFARTSHFDIAAITGAHVRFRLSDSPETRAVYPFSFILDMDFRLEGLTLHMTATVTNPGVVALPFSLGFHPAFAWPLPGAMPKQGHCIAFATEEQAPIRRLDPVGGLVLSETENSPVRGRELSPTPEMFAADAMIWDRLESRALAFGAGGGSWLDLSFPDMPMLGIWQKPGAGYLCIEPWQGHADPVGFAGDFREKPGVVELAPGATRSFRMDVTVRPG